MRQRRVAWKTAEQTRISRSASARDAGRHMATRIASNMCHNVARHASKIQKDRQHSGGGRLSHHEHTAIRRQGDPAGACLPSATARHLCFRLDTRGCLRPESQPRPKEYPSDLISRQAMAGISPKTKHCRSSHGWDWRPAQQLPSPANPSGQATLGNQMQPWQHRRPQQQTSTPPPGVQTGRKAHSPTGTGRKAHSQSQGGRLTEMGQPPLEGWCPTWLW